MAVEFASMLDCPPALTVITGHYGVGKTNLSLNLLRRWLEGGAVGLTLIDLDVVNPYFRSSDSADWLAANSVRLLGPSLAGSTLDTPSLSPGIGEAIRLASAERPVLIDVGGDPDGARALARYAAQVKAVDHVLVYVTNFSRPEVATPDDAQRLLREIESQAGLAANALIGNSHLKQLTTAQQIAADWPKLCELSRACGLPVAAITAPAELVDELVALLAGDAGSAAGAPLPPVLPMLPMVTTPWE